MKTFDELTFSQKDDAMGIAEYELINLIAEGTLDVYLSNKYAQSKLENILKNGRTSENNRIIKLQILHDKQIKQEIDKLALMAAEGSMYTEDGLPIKKEVVSDNLF